MPERTPKRVRRTAKRRKSRPVLIINVTTPGRIVIEHGTREDAIDAPEGTTIERIKHGEANQGPRDN